MDSRRFFGKKGKSMNKLILNVNIFILFTITGCSFTNTKQVNANELSVMGIIGLVAAISIFAFFGFLSLHSHCRMEKWVIDQGTNYAKYKNKLDYLNYESQKALRRMIASLIRCYCSIPPNFTNNSFLLCIPNLRYRFFA